MFSKSPASLTLRPLTIPGRSLDPALRRALDAMAMLRQSQERIPQIQAESNLDAASSWDAYWLPILLAYGQQSLNGNRDVRQTALGHLQRTLVAPEILSTGSVDLTVIFERILFPVLEELLKPQVFRRDPEGMGETRLRASGLLCRIFLHYLVQLSEQGMPRMTELWLQILGYLDRFMHSGRRDQMVRAHPKSLLVPTLTDFIGATVRGRAGEPQKCAARHARLRLPRSAERRAVAGPGPAVGCDV